MFERSPFCRHLPAIGHVLQFMRDQAPEYVRDTISLSEAGVTSAVDILRTELIETFCANFGIIPTFGGLTTPESQCAELLLTDKYLSDRWNIEGKEH